ncbi:DUF1934 domain-containing protein [Desertibacillus haloalkaliphilus]|uniref:DUF1934 domain-containing protein n=1 Tax=Desertibacillus haloalkaliphilus TaxID=1328930 RepID=UPI001C2666D1|nr:DUF1934 domain-containing protein [Desertibacillus haloalkaliphilus]MBU8905840.1 DUF1934 domain-containing protein [Desertibacillus haloalkaliphilus]
MKGVSRVEQIPIQVHMTTEINDDENRHERIVVKANGTLVEKNETVYIRYTEEVAEMGEVRNTIKVKDDEVMIIRQGAIAMKQRFKSGKQTESIYKSRYGAMEMKADTEAVAYTWYNQEKVRKLVFSYLLQLQGEDVGHYLVTLKIKEDL